MAKSIITNGLLTAIADAIREKTGSTIPMTPAEMADAVSDIQSAASVIDCSIAGNIVINDTTVRQYVLSGCANLTGVTFTSPLGVRIFDGAFRDSGIATAAGANVHQIDYEGFYNCANLETVDFPNLVTLYNASLCFSGCTSLKSVNFPLLQTIPYACFEGDTALKTADFTALSSIDTYAFRNSGIESLIIRNTESVVTLSAATALTGTPIHRHTGFIYVPAALVDAYKAATNWSVFASQIVSLEELGGEA
jgi:hypothetical protein